MHRQFFLGVWSGVLFSVTMAGAGSAAVILQRAGEDYLAWEAEDFHSNEPGNLTPSPWIVVDDINASGGQALRTSVAHWTAPGGGIATYQLQFDTTGTYRLYFRMNAFDGGSDSMYRSPAFNEQPAIPPSEHLPVTNGYEWFNDNFSPQNRYVVTVGDLGNTLTLSIGSREANFRVDRLVLSTATNLTSAELDTMLNWDILPSHFTNADAGDSNWSTADNWDGGVPDSMKVTYIAGSHIAALDTTAAAHRLTIGHTESTLPGSGTLNQTGGSLTVADRLLIGVNAGGSQHIVGTYTATGGATLTVGEATPMGRAELTIGHNTAGSNFHATGTIDLSEASEFTAHLTDLSVGILGSSGNNSATVGTLKLPAAGTSAISASTITLGDSGAGSTPQVQGTVQLGHANTIRADAVYVGRRKAVGEMTIVSGGALTLEGLSSAKANLYVGYNDNTTQSNYPQGTMDLTGGTFNATLENLVVGFHAYPWGGSDNGSGTGVLSFDAGEVTADSVTIGSGIVHSATGYQGRGIGTLNFGGDTFTAGSIALASVSSRTEGTLNQSGGTLTVTGDVTGGPGTSAVHVDGGTMTVNGNLTANTLRVGYNGRTATASAAGDVVIDGPGSLRVGFRDSTTVHSTNTTVGTLDLSGSASAALRAGAIDIGVLTVNLGTLTRGTLKLPATGASELSAATITLGNSGAGLTPTVHGIVELGQSTTIRANTMYVGRQKAQGDMTIAAGGTLELAGLNGGKTNLYVGYNDNDTTTNVARGTMDLAEGVFTATLGQLVIGYHRYPWSDGDTGSGTGTLSFSAGTVTADSVTIGMGDTHPSHGRQGRGVGTLNMGGGTFTAGSVDLAVGSARASGTLNLTGGTLTVQGDVTGGQGASTLNIDGGTMDVAGSLSVDVLRVGHQGRTAFATIEGADVHIGRGSGPGLTVGHRLNTTSATSGTLDLSAAGSVNIDTGTASIAYNESTTSSSASVAGTLTLSAAGPNVITADLFRLGQIDAGSTGNTAGTLNLGADNVINADTFIVGGDKARGIVTIAAGGTLTLGGRLGAATNLLVGGNNSVGTSTNPVESHFDLGGGTLHAVIDDLVIGQYQTGTGSGKGRFSMGAGAVTANAILLADSSGSTAQNTTGTLDLSGGTLATGTIAKGAGTAAFNFTGGTLHVDTFGSAERPFHLTQNGGTMAPGNSIGTTTIYGDYIMNDGTLEIEIAGLTDHDFVMVHGDATLAGSLHVLLLDGFLPPLGTHFDVLLATGELDLSELALTGDLPSSVFGWWEMAAVPGADGDGFLLRLSAVPEPSNAVLLMLGFAMLLGSTRRRR